MLFVHARGRLRSASQARQKRHDAVSRPYGELPVGGRPRRPQSVEGGLLLVVSGAGEEMQSAIKRRGAPGIVVMLSSFPS